MDYCSHVRVVVAMLNSLHPTWSREKCMLAVRKVPPPHLSEFKLKVSVKLREVRLARLRVTALKKLTPQERAALGISPALWLRISQGDR